MPQTVLILGSTGRFGRHAAAQFSGAGWMVRHFDRARDDLALAARGADIIVNGWNPPYTDWAAQLPALHAQVIEAARQNGSTVILPGNVYVFGRDTPAPWTAESPHDARNPLGRIRIEMEQAYQQAPIRTIMLRGGDFIDTARSGNWFDKVLTKSLAKGRFTYPGDPGIPHAWAYLPDFCRAVVQLAERRETLPGFTDIPFPGYTMSGRDMADVLNRIHPNGARLRRMSWRPLALVRPFWPMAGCLLEMRYLWDTPHWLDRAKFDHILPGFRNTPVRDALASAVELPSVEHKVHPDKTVPAGG
ncbi:epimerase [Sedimentitalea sp. XS_ASV28]|uniref:epimerase n=1 Tax=Sedimentitalea sp. XS_ASV28 TaxID=3241296 RepID=UPI0035161687